MDLSTEYMGLKLKNPLVPSASPLSRELDDVKKLEDAGAAAVVLHSIFEEQVVFEADELEYFLTRGTYSYAEALTYFPQAFEYNMGPEDYLEHIRKAKAATQMPIIASLNGLTSGGWINYAKQIEQAGADAIELNVYFLAADATQDSSVIEQNYIDILGAVKSSVKIPVAIKLSPFFTSITAMAKKLDAAGANALVLFNRFYQPDLDVEKHVVKPGVVLSHSNDLRMPLRWIAILHGRIKAGLAGSTGVHTAQDVVKLLMAGADVAQMCSVLLVNGPEYLGRLLHDLQTWMETHKYDSVAQMKGTMSQKKVAEPGAFERANYIKALNQYRVHVR